MKATERIAIARIFSDLIKADRIINAGEMDYWHKICAKYAISQELKISAQRLSFADALNLLHNSADSDTAQTFLADCLSMTVSDGFCSHSEALIIIALKLMLDKSSIFDAHAISIPQANFNIDTASVLYVESRFDSSINNDIQLNYRAIFKEFQLAGFHFIYLPQIINHYKNADPDMFQGVLSYLAPDFSEQRLAQAYNELTGMSTASFCQDLLCNKLGISTLRNSQPSLLIKIGNSIVGDVTFANYLKIQFNSDVLKTIQEFVDNFRALLSNDVAVISAHEEKPNQLLFHGIHKQLLDIFLTRKNVRSRIILDPYKEEISFPDIEAKLSGLHRREKALYALLLCAGPRGLNFTPPRTAADLHNFSLRLQQIQRQYSAIYRAFGGTTEATPDLSIPEIRRPIFSCLKRSLANLKGLYNPADYSISKDPYGAFSVNVEPDLLFIRTLDAVLPLQHCNIFNPQ